MKYMLVYYFNSLLKKNIEKNSCFSQCLIINVKKLFKHLIFTFLEFKGHMYSEMQMISFFLATIILVFDFIVTPILFIPYI